MITITEINAALQTKQPSVTVTRACYDTSADEAVLLVEKTTGHDRHVTAFYHPGDSEWSIGKYYQDRESAEAIYEQRRSALQGEVVDLA